MALQTTFRFNIILGNARHAATTIRDGFEDAQAAIILSVASLEAFLHELAWLLESNTIGARGEPRLETLREALRDLEAARAQLLTKIRISYLILSGKSLPKGESPYQDLNLLIQIRNELVHPKVVSVDDESPETKPGIKLIRGLNSRKVLPAEAMKSVKPWTKDVLIPETAKWAVNIAHAGMADLVSQLPDKHETRGLFESVFVQFEPL